MKETKEITAYQCGYCGGTYLDKSKADYCHSDRTCGVCGIVIGKDDYYINCKSCRDKKERDKLQSLIDKASKLTYDEYMELNPDRPVVYNDGVFFDDLDYLLDKIHDNEDENPIVWGAKETIIELDPYFIIQNFEENCELEEFSMDKSQSDEIKQFCDDWNNRNAKKVYYEDNRVIILVKESE
jgi:hypothetical protein